MNKSAPYNASTIAQWFLFYNNVQMAEADADLISNLKLQKLLYQAQGCYLALNGIPLFKEDIEAWEHGPVVPEIYRKYKSYHSNGIEYQSDYDGSISSADETILKEVYEQFGQYSAWGLRNMTHHETPWLSTKRNDVIDLNVISDYFKENYIE